MQYELLIALFGFAFASSARPGPNNMMLMSSGLTYGFKRTIPHMLGVRLGHAAMLICIGLGLGQAFEAVPQLYTALKVAGASYMLYLAYKIATSGPIKAKEGTAKPFSFLQAAAFQWVNPKAVIMAITAVSLYTTHENYTAQVLLVGLVFCLVNLPSVSIWAFFGTALRQFLKDAKKVRIFNICMAGLLVLSLIPMLV
jgi:threonine/homoserine/homoserine lactone efflux protein